MKLITRDTDYAVRALRVIAQSKEKMISTGYLEEKLGVPRTFLRKILQLLQKAGILNSTKGNQGGFILARSAQKISLLDLVKVFQGDFCVSECVFLKKPCTQKSRCPLRSELKKIEDYALKRLGAVTLKSLLANTKKIKETN